MHVVSTVVGCDVDRSGACKQAGFAELPGPLVMLVQVVLMPTACTTNRLHISSLLQQWCLVSCTGLTNLVNIALLHASSHTGLYRATQGHTGLYTAVKGYTGAVTTCTAGQFAQLTAPCHARNEAQAVGAQQCTDSPW